MSAFHDPFMRTMLALMSEPRIPAPWPESEDVWRFAEVTFPLESRSGWYRRKVRGRVQNQTSTIMVTETYDGIVADVVKRSMGGR